MAPNDRPDEIIARELLSRALGVAVEQNDDGTEPGMFDFRFRLPDGRFAAGEMTTLTDEDSRAWQAEGRREPRIVGSRSHWMVSSRRQDIRFKELLDHLEIAAPLLEARSVADPRDLTWSDPLTQNPSVRWLRQADIRVHGVAATNPEHHGRVYPLIVPTGSFVGDSLQPTLEWFEAELATPRYDGEFNKLADSGLSEHHLVLRIDLHGVPDTHYFALTDRSVSLPTRPPEIPCRYLTGLWLIPEFPTSLIWWTADSGWHRQPLNQSR
jgi:hypothetical protein